MFAIHPLHVESVAWISGRKDVLSTLFWILTIGAYFRYVEKRSVGWYAIAMLLFALGLMAKPMVVTLPFVLLLLDYWPLNRMELKWASSRRLVWEKIPFFVVATAGAIVTFFLFKSTGQVKSIESLPLIVRAGNAVVSYVKYIWKTIWPSQLAANYPYPENKIPYWLVLGATVLLLVITIWVIRLGKKHKYLPVGWFMFLGTLVPVIGLIQISDLAMADRYTYLSLTGLFIIVAWGAGDLLEKWKYRKIVLSISSPAVIFALAVCAWFQTAFWHDSISLFEHAIEVTKNNYLAYNNRGFAYNEKSRYDLAIADFNKALDINPRYDKAYNNRGFAYVNGGRYDFAISDFNKAIEMNPNNADAYYNRGTFYSQVKGQYDLAIADYSKVLEINPTYPKAHNNRGIAYYRKGEYDLAISDYNKELEINPMNADIYNNRGNAYWQGKGKPDLAIADYDKSIEINPKNAEVYFNKAGACENAGRKKEAIETYEVFIKYAPVQYAPNIEQAKKKIKELEQQ